jgi:alpha/beta superfamily hydrolase
LQRGEPHHAARSATIKPGRKSFSVIFCDFYGVAAGGVFETGFGELTDALRKIGVRGRRMRRPQRLAMN